MLGDFVMAIAGSGALEQTVARPAAFLAVCPVVARLAEQPGLVSPAVALASLPSPTRTVALVLEGTVYACRRDDLGHALVLWVGDERIEMRVDSRTELQRVDGTPAAARELKKGVAVVVTTDDEGMRALTLTVGR